MSSENVVPARVPFAVLSLYCHLIPEPVQVLVLSFPVTLFQSVFQSLSCQRLLLSCHLIPDFIPFAVLFLSCHLIPVHVPVLVLSLFHHLILVRVSVLVLALFHHLILVRVSVLVLALFWYLILNRVLVLVLSLKVVGNEKGGGSGSRLLIE